MEKEIEFNHKVIDTLSGYTGIVTGIAKYSTGLKRVLVVAKSDGKSVNEEWIDVGRLAILSEDVTAERSKETNEDSIPTEAVSVE